MKKKLIYYGIPTIIGAIMGLLTASAEGAFESEPYYDLIKILCDAFTVPGVVLILFGVLMIISREGIFDGITYAVSHLFYSLIPGRMGDKNEKYYDYVERKRGKRGAPIQKYVMIPGAIYFVVSLILLAIYYI